MLKIRRFFSRFVYTSMCRIQNHPNHHHHGHSLHRLPRFYAILSFLLMFTMFTTMLKINPSSLSSKPIDIQEEFDSVPMVQLFGAPKPKPVPYQPYKLFNPSNRQRNRKLSLINFGENEDDDDDENNVDVVYTWVNGSDPEHLKLVRRYKVLESYEIGIEMNQMAEINDTSTITNKKFECHHKFCVQDKNLLIVVPQLPSSSSIKRTDFEGERIEKREEFIPPNNADPSKYLASNVSLINLSEIGSSEIPRTGHKLYAGFYTADCSMAINCLANIERTYILHRTVMKVRTRYTKVKDAANPKLPDFIEKQLEWKIQSGDNWVVKMVNDTELWQKATQSEDVFDTGSGVSYHLYKANIVWDLGDPAGIQMTAGRFAENNELKYSIRALEKNAPWVRKIYIVTNGQVPSWLNTSNPKIRVVTHEEIFTNKSHLPTFSSPAIESHLFQIKGLAKRFIYINDDILITSPVKKEDFYTDEKGFRLQMAWAAPASNSGKCTIYGTFDCSVMHVNSVYDAAYGRTSRRVPAHVPHYIDRDIAASMVSRFAAEFDHTSSSRFRRATDMQFAFSYYYYVIHEGWKYERLGESDMRFFMVEERSATLRSKLDMLKRRPRKFACFNDDIDYGKTNRAKKLRALMNEFFNSLYPTKSSFEL